MSEISEYKEECMRRIKETQKYKKYSEDDLIDELYEKDKKLQQKENIIKEVRKYVEEHKQKGYRTPMSDDYEFWNELNEDEIKELLEILDKGE